MPARPPEKRSATEPWQPSSLWRNSLQLSANIFRTFLRNLCILSSVLFCVGTLGEVPPHIEVPLETRSTGHSLSRLSLMRADRSMPSCRSMSRSAPRSVQIQRRGVLDQPQEVPADSDLPRLQPDVDCERHPHGGDGCRSITIHHAVPTCFQLTCRHLANKPPPGRSISPRPISIAGWQATGSWLASPTRYH
jgi:hypothetical protein